MELKSQEQLKKELSAPLPPEAIKQHPTKTYLSSIKAIYVTERLNDVFGIGKWRINAESVERGEKGMVVVKVILTIPQYEILYECYGGNDNGGENSKNFDLGDAYKGATTDAITKIGSYLEIGIDVFKGKSSIASKQETKPPVDKPIVHPDLLPGTEKWKLVKNGMVSGVATIERIKLKNTLSELNEKLLLNEVDIEKKEIEKINFITRNNYGKF